MCAIAKIIGNVKIGPTIILLIILTIIFIIMIILDYFYRIRRAEEEKACKKKTNDSDNYVAALRIFYIIFYILSILTTYRIIYTNIKSRIMKMSQQGFGLENLSGMQSSSDILPLLKQAQSYTQRRGSSPF